MKKENKQLKRIRYEVGKLRIVLCTGRFISAKTEKKISCREALKINKYDDMACPFCIAIDEVIGILDNNDKELKP